jgi:hypothetical protein
VPFSATPNAPKEKSIKSFNALAIKLCCCCNAVVAVDKSYKILAIKLWCAVILMHRFDDSNRAMF